MRQMLGRPLAEALADLPAGVVPPVVLETAAPLRPGQERRPGTARIVACRDGVWIVARFQDRAPREKEIE